MRYLSGNIRFPTTSFQNISNVDTSVNGRWSLGVVAIPSRDIVNVLYATEPRKQNAP